MLCADPAWALGVVPGGFVCVGPATDVEIGFDGTVEQRQQLLERLAIAADAGSIARDLETTVDEAQALLEQLEAADVLKRTRRERPAHGHALVDAILVAERGGELPRLVWTAREALFVPEGVDPETARRVLRAFAAGVQPRSRLSAYGYAARWLRRTVVGDEPEPEALESAREFAGRLDPRTVRVVDLQSGSATEIVPGAIEGLGPLDTHRLGPVLRTEQVSAPDLLKLGAAVALAHHACPNLAMPDRTLKSWGLGMGSSPEEAELIARGEAAERYCLGDPSDHALITARGSELPGALPGDRVFLMSDRQYDSCEELERYDPRAPYSWIRSLPESGEQRWVLAQAVLVPFDDPNGRRPAVPGNSSGAAAHGDLRAAMVRALFELIERDAFMWTWVQGVSRERISPRGLHPELAGRLRALEALGFEATLVNLTLDTCPVVLCVAQDESRLAVGAASRSDPGDAAFKAVGEAACLVALAPRDKVALSPEAVRTPMDHHLLHWGGGGADAGRFLAGSSEQIRIDEIEGGSAPFGAVAERIAEPLFVEMTSNASRPLKVVRGIVPGMIPLTFGFDREPLGMPRLAEPKTTSDGRVLGRPLELARAAPIMPHPFN